MGETKICEYCGEPIHYDEDIVRIFWASDMHDGFCYEGYDYYHLDCWEELQIEEKKKEASND